MRSKNQKIVDELEMLSEWYIGAYSQENRTILERRWRAYKFILLGVHSKAENKKALELTERLMEISNSKHTNKKDDFLLNELVKKIMKFERKAYPGVGKI